MANRSEDDQPTSRAQFVANEIEDELLAKRLPVGTHLGRRAEFMERFGISPPIMSETMRILRTRGLIDVRRGAGGGLFVASQPPQIRLGAMDLWFHEGPVHPLDLFEARVHLEACLTSAAFDRATVADHPIMREAALALGGASTARDYLVAVMELHRAIARAARISVLIGMHDAIVASIKTRLSRAEFMEGHEEMLRHSLQVHDNLVGAIIDRDASAFAKITTLHDGDLVRADDPRRSPHVQH